MRRFQRLLNHNTAVGAAKLMKFVCYLMIVGLIIGLCLSIAGRQRFIMIAQTGTYENAMLAFAGRGWEGDGMFAELPNMTVRLFLGPTVENVDLVSRISLSALFVLHVLPVIYSFILMARLFDNVSKGRIFIQKNAYFLLYIGLIRIAVNSLVPIAQLLLGAITEIFTPVRFFLTHNGGIITGSIQYVAILVAAYIIHYGVSLQDEVDHTL